MEEIFIPASGMAMEDVLFTEWLKQPGDQVEAGEPVAVVETDKSTVELSGTMAGRLSRHLVEAGARVPGGTTVAYLLGDGENEPGSYGVAGAAAAGANGGQPAGVPEARAHTGQEQDGHAPSPAEPASDRLERETDGRHRMSPRQRREMAEAAAKNAQTTPVAPSPVAPSPAPRFRPRGLGSVETASRGVAQDSAVAKDNRKATAALVSESWQTIPHFSVGRDLRVDGMLEATAASKAAGTGLTATDFLILALAEALESIGERSDLGLAVATDWGVLIPVLPSVAGKSLADVAKQRVAAVTRARNRRLASSDSAPVFATLSNLGPTGVTWFTGVVPVNQVALLTVGEVSLRPAVEGRGLVVAPMLTAIVTADHRRYDGVDSAKLLGAFADNLRAVIDGASDRSGR